VDQEASFWGFWRGHCLDRHVGVGKGGPQRVALCRTFGECRRYGREHVLRFVVMDHLCVGYRNYQLRDIAPKADGVGLRRDGNPARNRSPNLSATRLLGCVVVGTVFIVLNILVW
jgi:hypothetical protein